MSAVEQHFIFPISVSTTIFSLVSTRDSTLSRSPPMRFNQLSTLFHDVVRKGVAMTSECVGLLTGRRYRQGVKGSLLKIESQATDFQ